MAHPLVVHCQHAPYDIYIGRGPNSPWGNPFRIGPDGDRDQVIERYRLWLPHQPRLLAALAGLAGKRLGCWCAPRRCHGDILAPMAAQAAGLNGDSVPAMLRALARVPEVDTNDVCAECEADIPADEPSEVNDHHRPSCSLHPNAICSPIRLQPPTREA